VSKTRAPPADEILHPTSTMADIDTVQHPFEGHPPPQSLPLATSRETRKTRPSLPPISTSRAWTSMPDPTISPFSDFTLTPLTPINIEHAGTPTESTMPPSAHSNTDEAASPPLPHHGSLSIQSRRLDKPEGQPTRRSSRNIKAARSSPIVPAKTEGLEFVAPSTNAPPPEASDEQSLSMATVIATSPRKHHPEP
jgi:hypothetical protein